MVIYKEPGKLAFSKQKYIMSGSTNSAQGRYSFLNWTLNEEDGASKQRVAVISMIHVPTGASRVTG